MVRYILLQQSNGRPFLVKVADEKEFEDTLRYLSDCGIQFDVNEELEPMMPGELSDLLAPRDE
jgi:hypothetical protein